jgi:hypothetical protein
MSSTNSHIVFGIFAEVNISVMHGFGSSHPDFSKLESTQNQEIVVVDEGSLHQQVAVWS